ncbi:MAG: hypothetical protein GX237_04980 [Clostridiales bacterium]|nr:hypothetical protein [Clostridiales bacterium]
MEKAIEVLEIRAGGNFYGVDVSEVREILPYDKKPKKIPNSHPFIEGVVKPRDFIIPIVDLVACLKLEDVEDRVREMLIVSNIKDLNIGFHVDHVEGIHRTNTEHITEVGEEEEVTTSVRDAISGILTIKDRKIEMLDLRYIINYINPDVEL